MLADECCVKNGRPETGRKATAHGADSARGTLPGVVVVSFFSITPSHHLPLIRVMAKIPPGGEFFTEYGRIA